MVFSPPHHSEHRPAFVRMPKVNCKSLLRTFPATGRKVHGIQCIDRAATPGCSDGCSYFVGEQAGVPVQCGNLRHFRVRQLKTEQVKTFPNVIGLLEPGMTTTPRWRFHRKITLGFHISIVRMVQKQQIYGSDVQRLQRQLNGGFRGVKLVGIELDYDEDL